MTPEDTRALRKALCNCRTLIEEARKKASGARQMVAAALDSREMPEEMGSLFTTLDIALDRWAKAEGVLVAHQRARDLFPQDEPEDDDSPTGK